MKIQEPEKRGKREVLEDLDVSKRQLWAARADERDFDRRVGVQLDRIKLAQAKIEELTRLRDSSPERCRRLEERVSKLEKELELVQTPKVKITRRAVEQLALVGLGRKDKAVNQRAFELIQRLNAGGSLEQLWHEYKDLEAE